MRVRDIINLQKNTPTSFTDKVLDIVRKIPEGSTLTYAQVAVQAGSSRAARVVGSIMAKNKDLAIPCHRVIRSDGRFGKYNGLRLKSKEELLKKEGVVME